MNEPYMGRSVGRVISVPVSGAFLQRCRQRWRSLSSLREAAKAISLIDADEAERRRIEHGDALDFSGLRISYQTIVNLDVQLREGTPTTVDVGLITYGLLCAWMDEAPDLPDDPRIQAIYQLWKLTYDEEKRRQGKAT